MMTIFRRFVGTALFFCALLPLGPANSNASVPQLPLSEYLNQVRGKFPDYLAATEKVSALRGRQRESRLDVSPELFANFSYVDDQSPQTNPFMANRTRTDTYALGLRSLTTFGLSGELALTNGQVALSGMNPLYIDFLESQNSALTLSLNQSLWKNAFGAAVRSQMKIKDLGVAAELERAVYEQDRLILAAENLYWTVASYQKIIALQEANVAVAARTAQVMQRKFRQNLADDVDALQTEAALEARQMELQQSIDSLSGFLRQFNKMRLGSPDDRFALESVPVSTWTEELKALTGKSGQRRDFRAMRLGGELMQEQGRLARENLTPSLDLFGRITLLGREPDLSGSLEEVGQGEHPKYEVGLKFSLPLNFGLVSEVRDGYAAQITAGTRMLVAADEQQARSWQDQVARTQESLALLKRATALQEVHTQVILRERKRLQSGRSTTFQVLQAEQNLAQAQIQMVRAELQLVQELLELRSYEVTP